MPRAFARFGPLACALLLVSSVLHATALHADEPPLVAYNADIAQSSISGISSGAYMAVQFGMAWSSIVIGVGAVAGGPFGCSDGSASAALSTCMGGAPSPDVVALIARTDAWSRSGAIDDTANIARQRIYLFNGYNDSVVTPPVSNALHAFYDHYRPGSLFYQTAIGSGHAQVTIAYGGGCADNGGEFINRCDYDQAGIILQHIYGALQPRNDKTLGGHVISFRQADFTGVRAPIDDSLDDRGFVYVPAACDAREPCRVHVALHGCLQSYSDIGEDFVRHAGYNEWADTNRIIVLYPQIKAVGVTQFGITNPQSCWDWWGYLDARSNAVAHLAAEDREADRRDQGDDRPDHQRCGRVPGNRRCNARRRRRRVIAVDASDSAIDLAWTVVPGATGYDVFRTTASDQIFARIGTVVGPSYGDAGLKPATAYRYRVRAASSGATSDFSALVEQQTRRKVPPCDEPGTCPVR